MLLMGCIYSVGGLAALRRCGSASGSTVVFDALMSLRDSVRVFARLLACTAVEPAARFATAEVSVSGERVDGVWLTLTSGASAGGQILCES